MVKKNKGKPAKPPVTILGEEVGRRIRERREEVGLTQEQLGDRLSEPRTKGMISQWEKGTTTPTLEQIVEIARELHTDQTWVAFGSNSRTIPIIGQVITGGVVVVLNDVTERVAVPPALEGVLNLTAWRIYTDGIPSLHHGDLLFAGVETNDLNDAIGFDAIVELEAGKILYRRIEHGTKPGCVTLADTRGVAMPDVKPKHVWVVLSIVKGAALDRARRAGGSIVSGTAMLLAMLLPLLDLAG